jgi:hypothetical protein
MAQYVQDVPSSLQAVVDRALAKNPAARFASADALLSALDTVQLPAQPRDGLTGEIAQGDEEGTARAIPSKHLASTPTRPGTSKPTLPTPEGIYAYLCYEQEGAEPQQFALRQKSVIVGRTDPKRRISPDIDLSSIDPSMTVSRQHARIRFEESHFYIEDLKSRNKTRLRELPLIPLQPELLGHGDIIQLGSVHLKFQVPGMG